MFSRAVEHRMQEDILRSIESNAGCCTEDALDSDREELGNTPSTPQKASAPLDTLDEHAMIVGSPKVQDLLRQAGEEFLPGSHEQRITQPGHAEMTEMVD